MRIVLAILVLVLLAIGSANASSTRHAAPAYVVVLKGKPVPGTRRVAVHASVTWFNADRAAHRIASDHGRWAAFRLRHGARHVVRFDRRGRYPYKVDGKANGVIVVGAGGGGSSNGPTTTFFHYDVHVSGHAQSIRTYTGATRADWNGTETLTIDWQSDFSNVTLKKYSDSGTFVIGHGNTLLRGSTDSTFIFKETRGDIYGPCQGTLPFGNLGTHLLLGGSRASGKNQFTFWSQLDLDEGTRLSNEITSQTEAACANHLLGKTLPSWNGGDFAVDGLTFHPFNDLLELHADRSDNATSLWSPLKQLSTGAPFTLETGTRSNTLACGDGCDAQEFLQLHADVKRHR